MEPKFRMPHSRNSLRVPEQYLHLENEERRDANRRNHTIPIWSKDKKSVIIIGEGPNGFGMWRYDVSGDQLQNGVQIA